MIPQDKIDPNENVVSKEDFLRLIFTIKNLIIACTPESLLNIVYSNLYSSPNEQNARNLYLLLFYSHGIYSSFEHNLHASNITDTQYINLLENFKIFYQETVRDLIFYQSPNAEKEPFYEEDATKLRIKSMISWITIRRSRYPNHDVSFLDMMLRPHAEVLMEVYGIDFISFINGCMAI